MQGPAGSGRAYAVVNPVGRTAAPGSCPLLKAKNVLGARRPQLGFYCVTAAPGISDTTDGHMAGVEWDLTAGVVGAASAMPFAVDIGGGDLQRRRVHRRHRTQHDDDQPGQRRRVLVRRAMSELDCGRLERPAGERAVRGRVGRNGECRVKS